MSKIKVHISDIDKWIATDGPSVQYRGSFKNVFERGESVHSDSSCVSNPGTRRSSREQFCGLAASAAGCFGVQSPPRKKLVCSRMEYTDIIW